MGEMDKLTLHIVTPVGAGGRIACDSIRLTLSDDESGRGGGSYGVRPGHTKALLALGEGKIEAYLAGETVLSGVGGEGFATIEKNSVTVVTEEFRKCSNQ